MNKSRPNIEPLKLKKIGARLRGLRDELSITLEKMNKLTGISRSYISDFERGKKLPSAKYLFFLIEKFSADINYIFTGQGEMFIRAKDEQKEPYDFGKYEEEIEDLLYHITRIPNALYSVLGHFSDYKVNKEKFIKSYLEKMGNREKMNNKTMEEEE